MKTFWTSLCVLAIANLLALTTFVGWLVHTDRLSMERVRSLRAVIGKPIAQEVSEQEEQARADQAARDQAAAEARAGRPPLTAAEKLQARIEATELDRQRIERLKLEIADLQRALAADRRALADERAAFEAEKVRFEETLASASGQAADEQFAKTLKVLVSQKPQQAVALLKQMLAEPTPPTDVDMAPVPNGAAPAASPAPAPDEARLARVVAYLDAMGEKPRGKIIETLTKSDPALAAALLERLRTRGSFARVP